MACNRLRMARTEAGLARGLLYLRGIAQPTFIQYRNFTEEVPQAEGGQLQQGYENVTIRWESANSKTTTFIRNIVQDALDNDKRLYLTIPWNNGRGQNRWLNVYGIPHQIDPEEEGRWGGTGIAYANVTLFVNNLTVLGEATTF